MSIWREMVYKEISKVELSGRALDLGGSVKSDYQTLFRGSYTISTVNMDFDAGPDIVHDLEMPLPIDDCAYDAVLLINTLEHIFNYRQLLSESARVLAPGGSLVLVVPFLFPTHPSPEDFNRWTASALLRECEQLPFSEISIQPLGTGVFATRYLLLDRLLPRSLRLLSRYSFRYVAFFLDRLLVLVAKGSGKRYDPAHYALGHFVTAVKHTLS